jgi:hypothetical protein
MKKNYVGSQMNQTNSIGSKIQARILSGKQSYYVYGKLMKSRALKSSSKLTHCGRVTQICVFNTVKLGKSASSP